MADDVKRRDTDRGECSPCRGTGRVISNLGGEPHEVTCPWCDGAGKFVPGRDAQQFPAERDK
jgi:DnaJ-class molecular chaperone